MGDVSQRARRAPPAATDPQALLRLAGRDREAAREAMAALSLDDQVALVCSARVSQRAALIDLASSPEALVPRLPGAELCFTVKAVGLESATWLLELATSEQIVACLDLDAWRGHQPDPARLAAWIDAVAEVDDDALARDLDALDPELLVLYLQSRIAVVMKPSDSEDPGWQPPRGFQSLDGVFHFAARIPGDDVSAIVRVLRLLFERHYWVYFRMLQGVIWELESTSQEWALRWRTGRLEDMGFPPWDEAMGLYRYLPPEERTRLEGHERALDTGEWQLPVWIPELPEGRDSRHLVFRTLAQLEPEERRAAFYEFVSVANRVAVADRMDLADAETTPVAIEKAATWMSRGLEHVAAETGRSAAEVVRTLKLERLFRIGANLDPEAARPPPGELPEEEPPDTAEAPTAED